MKHIFCLTICQNYQNSINKHAKKLWSDNVVEFLSKRFQEFILKEGTILQTSCPHTLQQNGVVEQKQKYLLEVPRAFRFQSNVKN